MDLHEPLLSIGFAKRAAGTVLHAWT